MNLEKITIKNFRSIKEQVIKIEHNCIILVVDFEEAVIR